MQILTIYFWKDCSTWCPTALCCSRWVYCCALGRAVTCSNVLSHNVVVNPKYCCTRSSIRRRAGEEEWEKKKKQCDGQLFVKNKRRISVRRAIAAPGLGHGRTHAFAYVRSLPYGLRLRRRDTYIISRFFLLAASLPTPPSVCRQKIKR